MEKVRGRMWRGENITLGCCTSKSVTGCGWVVVLPSGLYGSSVKKWLWLDV